MKFVLECTDGIFLEGKYSHRSISLPLLFISDNETRTKEEIFRGFLDTIKHLYVNSNLESFIDMVNEKKNSHFENVRKEKDDLYSKKIALEDAIRSLKRMGINTDDLDEKLVAYEKSISRLNTTFMNLSAVEETRALTLQNLYKELPKSLKSNMQHLNQNLRLSAFIEEENIHSLEDFLMHPFFKDLLLVAHFKNIITYLVDNGFKYFDLSEGDFVHSYFPDPDYSLADAYTSVNSLLKSILKPEDYYV